MISNSKTLFERLTKYGVVGIITNVIAYIAFVVFVKFSMAPVLASGVVYLLGMVVNYNLNRRWTFKSTNSHRHDMPRFVLAYGIGLVMTVLTMSILQHIISPYLAQIVAVVVAAISIFATLSLVAFSTDRRSNT